MVTGILAGVDPIHIIDTSGQICSRPHTSFGPPNGGDCKGNPLKFRETKPRLVKYYDNARYMLRTYMRLQKSGGT